MKLSDSLSCSPPLAGFFLAIADKVRSTELERPEPQSNETIFCDW